MGLVMNRTPIDSRLLNDDAFYEFFSDYYEKEAEARMRKLMEEENILVLDDSFDFRSAAGDKEYVDEVYKEYKKRNA